METFDLAVIGGGAAGFFCAVNAARMKPGIKVVILERSQKFLSKVRISGGGRCNVTHACFSMAEMSSRYPRGGTFLKRAFHSFFTTDTINWFRERGVELKTESDGRMFPESDNSQTIIDCLLAEASQFNVDARVLSPVRKISRSDRWILSTDRDEIFAEKICLATGGITKKGFAGFEFLNDLEIIDPVPSLFTFNVPDDKIVKLMGVSVPEAKVRITGTSVTSSGSLLVTHWGFSGPAVLKASAWGARELAKRNYKFSISINWLPGYNENTLREKFMELRYSQASKMIASRNPFGLASRLWEYFLEKSEIREGVRWSDLPAKQQNRLVRILTGDIYEVNGKSTFKEEFVTAGGIALYETDPATMECKKIPGLYFAGEVMDIDGITGGYNFQNAWTTGYIAAKAIVS